MNTQKVRVISLAAMNSSIQQSHDDLPIGAMGSTASLLPEDELLQIFENELDTAAMAESRSQPMYRSVKRLSKMIGGEYGTSGHVCGGTIAK